jgi:hypothetical protein
MSHDADEEELMKKTWLMGGLAVILAGPSFAQDAMVEGCEKFKADIAKQKEACAEENTAAAKITCKGKDELNAALRLFQTCGKKATAAATSGKSAGASTSASAGSSGGAAKEGAATREWKCKAVDIADNKDIAEAAAPKMMECSAALKEKVKAARCSTGGDKVEYLNQTQVGSRWTKGVKSAVACK